MARKPTTRSPSDRMLGVPEAARRVDYSEWYLRNLVTNGSPKAPPMRKVNGVWKIWLSDLDAWIEENAEERVR